MDIAKKKKRKEKEPRKNDNITSKLSKCQSDVDVRECDTVVHTSNRDGSSRNTAPGSVSHCHEFHSASAASTLLSEAQINVDDVPMIMSVTVTNNPTRAAGRRLTARSSWYLGRTQTMAKNELATRYESNGIKLARSPRAAYLFLRSTKKNCARDTLHAYTTHQEQLEIG